MTPTLTELDPHARRKSLDATPRWFLVASDAQLERSRLTSVPGPGRHATPPGQVPPVGEADPRDVPRPADAGEPPAHRRRVPPCS